MRTAICISGELRSYDITAEELRHHIINPLNADVFIYSWDTISGTWKTRNASNIYNNFLVDDVRHEEPAETLKRNLEALYSPISMVLEPFKEEYKNNIENVSRPQELIDDPNLSKWCQHDLAMFYTMYKCNELKKQYEQENNFKYDLVIKIRTDIRFPHLGSLKASLQDMCKNTLWYWPKDHNEAHVVSDKFAFSTSEIMDYYSSVFTKLNEYWAEGIMVESTQVPKISEHTLWSHFHEKSNYEVRSYGDEYYDKPRAEANNKQVNERIAAFRKKYPKK